MAVEQQTLETVIELNYTDLQSGLNKIEKDIKAIATQTEKTLSTLSNESAIYKDLVNKNTELRNLQKDISKYKSGNITGNIKNNQTLTESVKKVALIKQYVKDLNSVIPKTASGFQAQNTQLDKIQDKFANLNREALSLKGHYKTLGSSSGLKKLDAQLSEIQKQQQIINTLNKKGLVKLTSDDLRSLDSAKTKYRELKNQMADTKAELSDVSVGGLARSASVRALGYTVLFSAIAGVTQAMRAGVEYTLEYDTAITKLGVLLDTTRAKAISLEDSFVDLAKRYGDSLESINQVAFELARAGIEMDKLTESTKSVVLLAKLTGDSIETSAGSIISFLEVFGKDRLGRTTASVTELSASVATFANISRASTEDIKVFNNYALQTARTLGITKEIYTAVGASLNNFGVNLSSAGTSFQRLQKIFTKGNDTLDIFFQNIGLNRQDLLERFAQKGEVSNQAFIEFVKTLEGVDDVTFTNLTAGFDVLVQTTLNQLRNTATAIQENFRITSEAGEEQLLKAERLAEDFKSTFKKLTLLLLLVHLLM